MNNLNILSKILSAIKVCENTQVASKTSEFEHINNFLASRLTALQVVKGYISKHRIDM